MQVLLKRQLIDVSNTASVNSLLNTYLISKKIVSMSVYINYEIMHIIFVIKV